MTETFPAFFAAAPTLRVCDPLAAFLGAAQDGILEYHYADAVRLAGHSCPTVAGAYLLTRRGLLALYGDTLPERGGIAVQMREMQSLMPKAVSGQATPDELARFGELWQARVRTMLLEHADDPELLQIL